jgi:hypothetical protein
MSWTSSLFSAFIFFMFTYYSPKEMRVYVDTQKCSTKVGLVAAQSWLARGEVALAELHTAQPQRRDP